MSAGACAAKKILCDPESTQLQAITNTFRYLDAQAKSRYKSDPTDPLDMNSDMSKITKPLIDKAFYGLLAYLEPLISDGSEVEE